MKRKLRNTTLLITILLIMFVSFMPINWMLLLYFIFPVLIFIYLFNNLSLLKVIKRLYFLLPLLFLLIFSNSINKSIFILIKSIICLMILFLYNEKNPVLKTLSDLKYLRVPKIIISIIFFMHRYSSSIIRDLEKYRISFKLRSFNQKIPWVNKVKNIGNIIGTLFIKSIDNSEKLYNGMILRGFEGEIKVLDE